MQATRRKNCAVNIYRGFTTSGSGGSSPTITRCRLPPRTRQQIHGGSCEHHRRTTSGVIIIPLGWNIAC